MITLHVGFDDTDSPRRGCTTYIAALLVEKLEKLGVTFIDYPTLVRLNPNVPWKTRGNGALCLRIKCDEGQTEQLKETVIDTVEENADINYDSTDPGIVFFTGYVIPKELRIFAKQAIQGIAKFKDALSLIKAFEAEAVGFKRGRGIIGALAAIGETLEEDHTFEIITYRTPENRGTPRKIDAESVRQMNMKTAPYTFNNFDIEKNRVLITPRGPDPVLYGIRGETPEIVKQAHKMIRSGEPIERWVIFRTNHGTDAHLRKVKSIRDVKPFHPVIVCGVVAENPRIVPRRHVIFSIKDETGKIDCAAYEPTGKLRKAARELVVGDLIEAYGGVRVAPPGFITLNLEKMRILRLVSKNVFLNPVCPTCRKRMSSMGTNKGFKCKRCGFRSKKLKKLQVEQKRFLQEKLYVTSPRSQRHLTKPLCRYGKEKTSAPKAMIKDWHWP